MFKEMLGRFFEFYSIIFSPAGFILIVGVAYYFYNYFKCLDKDMHKKDVTTLFAVNDYIDNAINNIENGECMDGCNKNTRQVPNNNVVDDYSRNKRKLDGNIYFSVLLSVVILIAFITN